MRRSVKAGSLAAARANKAELCAVVPGLIADLRSDHAGEEGAVFIYRGILAGSRDPDLRLFASKHLATEQKHLQLLEALLPPAERSVFVPMWRVAGFLTGFLPTLGGPHAVYTTIDAVETFVDRHYEEQIRKLPDGALRAELLVCQADEVSHRNEARAVKPERESAALRAWTWLVGAGSELAVSVARRV
jgi:ubiquinone biosynthesis monooxygenase Coq7